VDEVIIGAPYTVSKDVLEKVYKVDVVIHGKTETLPDVDGQDPYALPKKLGLYFEIETAYSELTTNMIIERILRNRQVYEARNRRKAEKAALEEKLLIEERAKNGIVG
jgi:ethanolamine-phosphate cytidylyltransferase